MSRSGRWRTAPAVWVAPVLLLAVVYQVGIWASGVTTPLAVSSRASSALLFLFPVTVAAAAWERHRRDRWRPGLGTTTRSSFTVASEALTPTAAVAFGGYVLALALSWSEGDGIDAVVVGTSLVWLLTALTVGWSLAGNRAPALVVPSAFVAGFVWMAFPVAWEPLWLRHLNGAWYTCCRTGQSRSDLAAAAALLTAVATSCLAVAAHARTDGSQSPRRWGRRGGLVVAGFIAAGAATLLVADHGPDPAVPRPATELACSSHGAIEVCLWPEHASVEPLVVAATEELVRRVPLVASEVRLRISEAEGVEDGIPFGTAPWAERRDVTGALAIGVAQWCAGEIPPLELELGLLSLLDPAAAEAQVAGDRALAADVARERERLRDGELVCSRQRP